MQDKPDATEIMTGHDPLRIETTVPADFPVEGKPHIEKGLYIYKTPADLPLQLHDFCLEEPTTGHWLKHPYFISMFPVVTPGPVEYKLDMQDRLMRKFKEEGRYDSYVSAHERAYRMRALIGLLDEGAYGPNNAQQFWELAASVWRDSELPEDAPDWRALVEADVPCRHLMTSAGDRETLNAMPDVLTVYRGVQGEDELAAEAACAAGYQWTLSPQVAAFFSRRYLRGDDNAYVLTTFVNKRDVIAYMTGRNEQEVVIEPGVIELSCGEFTVDHLPHEYRQSPRRDWEGPNKAAVDAARKEWDRSEAMADEVRAEMEQQEQAGRPL